MTSDSPDRDAFGEVLLYQPQPSPVDFLIQKSPFLKPFINGDTMAVISMKHFLEAGVHFGHQTKRWNPKMAPYIYGVKSGIHIIDLRQTLRKLQEAYQYVKQASSEGKSMLFVGTKQSIQRIVLEEANRCDSAYINFRWLGGFLTNFSTVKQSIGRLQSFEEIAGEKGAYEGILKKEALQIERKRQKLDRSLGGVRTMRDVPGVIFIIDCKREHLAVREAQKLGIPIVGIADTNCDPSGIDYVIPGNDDSPKAVQLYANVIATAVIEGRAAREKAINEGKATEKKESSAPKSDADSKSKKPEAESVEAKPKKPTVKYKKPKGTESKKKAEDQAVTAAPAEKAEDQAPKAKIEEEAEKQAAESESVASATDAAPPAPEADSKTPVEKVQEKKVSEKPEAS